VVGAAGLALLVWLPQAAGERPGLGDPLDDHRIGLPTRVDAPVGEPRALSLTIAPRPGFRISRDAPMTVELSAGADGLQLRKRRYRRADAADEHAEAPRFDLRFKALRAGSHRLAVTVGFWVCDPHSCRSVSDAREVAIAAQ
jgi:hypothetical protein